MTSWPVIAVLTAVLAGAGCRGEDAPWTTAEILRDVEPELRRFEGFTDAVTEPHVLMWQVEEDPARNLVVEEALIWARAGERTQKKWLLLHVYRHPSDDNVWRRSVSYVEPIAGSPGPHEITGYRMLEAAPTADAVCGFIRFVRPMPHAIGFRRLSGRFVHRTWRRVIGTPPPCGFGRRAGCRLRG